MTLLITGALTGAGAVVGSVLYLLPRPEKPNPKAATFPYKVVRG